MLNRWIFPTWKRKFMTEYLTNYRKYILECIENENCDYSKLLDYHSEKLHQFQHERFIHLIVMALFALCTVMTILAIAIFDKLLLIPLAALLMGLLVPYIKHYFFWKIQYSCFTRTMIQYIRKFTAYPRRT